MHDLRITLLQDILAWEDPVANRDHFASLISEQTDTDLIILPEMFSTGFTVEADSVAEKMDGPTLAWMRELAMARGVAITGSLIIEESGTYYNRLIWMNPDGSFQFYDKRHLFRMGGEHERFGMGMDRIIVNYLGWKILPLICYDLRFPVWARNRLTDGAFEYDLILYIANWPAARNHPWKSLLMARAIENQAYVAGLNRVGNDGQGLIYSGDSRVISPKGEVIAAAKEGESEALHVTLDKRELEEFRDKFRVGLDWDLFSIDGAGSP